MGQPARPKFTFFQAGVLQLAKILIVANVAYLLSYVSRLS